MLAQRKSWKAEKSADQDKVRQMVLSEKLDEKTARSMFDQKHGKMKTTFDEIFPLLQDFHASLNKEQKETVAGSLEKFRKRWARH